MVKLCTLEGKHVRLVDIDGEVFTGKVGDYIWPEDNEPEVEGIVLDQCYGVTRNQKYNNPIEFDAPNIKEIEVIEQRKEAS